MGYRKTGSFIATDEGGKEYTILEYTEYVSTNDLSGSSEMETGYKRLKTLNGDDVSPLESSKNKFQIIKGNPIIITTTDPKWQNN